MKWSVIVWAFALALGRSASAQDTAGVGAVAGIVVDAAGTPVSGLTVCVANAGRCQQTDARGEFTIGDVRAGRYTLEIASPALPSVVTEAIEVRAGLVGRVAVALPRRDGLAETVTVTAPSFAVAEELKNSVYLASSQQVWQNAGGQQDVVRYVQTLPGAVVGTDDFRNDLIVRGGSPLENLYVVDNVEIPNINTFATFASAGGTVSMLDAQAINDATFVTGGFPASFGNRTSSVLQVTLREGRRDRVAGRATVGFAGAGGVVEGPVGKGGSWIVAARRSFLDLFTSDAGIGGVPVLYTLNAKATYDPSPRDRVWALNVSGYDTVRLGLTDRSDLDSELSTLDIHYDGRRSATGVNWQRTYGAGGVGLLGVAYSTASVRQNVRDLLRNGVPDPSLSVQQQIANGVTVFREDSGETEASVKYDATFYSRLLGKLQSGAVVKRVRADYDAASPFGSDSPFYVEPGRNGFADRTRATDWQSGAYLQGTRTFARRYTATAGARVDRYQYLDATRVAPRGSLSAALTSRVSLRVSAGRYYQQPFFLFLTTFPQNRELTPYRADHLVGGLAWALSAGTRLTVEAYQKRYAAYPVSSDIASLSLANVGDTFALRDILFPLISAGTGRATGVEIFAERLPSRERRWYGQANLAFARARQAGADGVLRPSSFDYPVVFNATGTYRITPRWDVSLRASALGGRPYTPVDPVLSAAQRRAVYDLSQVNAARGPAYVRIDVRVDRTFTIAGSTLAVFAGVQNVTNRDNLAGYSWDRRNNVLRADAQLGVFPILGLEWRFGG